MVKTKNKLNEMSVRRKAKQEGLSHASNTFEGNARDFQVSQLRTEAVVYSVKRSFNLLLIN